jgi:hypothetical protein
MTPEQREEFCGYLSYSDQFKKEATEPTGDVLDKLMGSSAMARWLAEHSEVAVLAALIGKGTIEMFNGAAYKFAVAHQADIEAPPVKPNGGHPASENRPVPGEPIA